MNQIPNIEDISIPETKRPLKYRGIGGNTDLWISEMSKRDSQLWGMQVPLWVIDNNVYDLREFMDVHPGGRSWLELTKGQDITVLFKTHHLDTPKCRQILKKYYISPTKKSHPQRFQFKQDDDYQKIKKRILQKYTIKQLTSSTLTQIRCYCIILIWFILFTLCGYLQSYILAIICGCLLISFYGIGHLFIHKPDNNNILKHIYLLLGFSSQQQQIIHAISHHPHPNTMLDYQYSAMQPIIELSKCQPITSWYKSMLAQIFVLFTVPGNALNKLIFGPLLGKEKFNGWYAVVFVEIIYLYGLGLDIWGAVGLWGVMVGVYGFLVGKMLLCSHRQPQLWSQGNPQIPNYFHHILSTTTDTTSTPINPFLSILIYSSFNQHIIHHLFPTIDHNKLSECNEILIKYCKQNNINVHMNINKNMIDCNRKMYSLRRQRKMFVFEDFFGGGKKQL